MTNLVSFEDYDAVRVITLNHPNQHNPFNIDLENSIMHALQAADTDTTIDAIVVYGGKGRSFSVGGDFNEVKLLSGGEDVDRWIDRIMNLYSTVLKVKKPTIACIDGMAIGIGFQFAMMFDWRVIADTGVLIMPELKHGIGCTIGSSILAKICGYHAMKEIVYGCEPINAENALQYHLANEIYPQEHLLSHAIQRAKKLAEYPIVSFNNTKQAINKSMIDTLVLTTAESKETHRACFATKSAEQHFISILGEKY